jgi:hypothetical protein
VANRQYINLESQGQSVHGAVSHPSLFTQISKIVYYSPYNLTPDVLRGAVGYGRLYYQGPYPYGYYFRTYFSPKNHFTFFFSFSLPFHLLVDLGANFLHCAVRRSGCLTKHLLDPLVPGVLPRR